MAAFRMPTLEYTFPSDVAILGSLTLSTASIINAHCSASMGLERTKLDLDDILFAVPLVSLRKSAAWKDALPDAPDATELGLANASGSPVVGTTTNGGSTASASEKALAVFALPAEYSDGQTISVILRAKVTVARTVSATIDLVAKQVEDGALGADICATAAQSLTTSYADYTFTITPTGLVAGDELALEICLATNDTGGSSDGYPALAKVSVECGCRG